ncbi:hypothetical protein C5Q98_06725 [Fastidiosipila sanguinis]|uniref:Uncharacterized protein n=1 Tax=Fastidiosipila sanguinis TaxID=236753 RepID=A0A2S0KPF6_9FIRM|nr:hypothetical protein C5Q98_06725 [Fastidiosipila sanguinis]
MKFENIEINYKKLLIWLSIIILFNCFSLSVLLIFDLLEIFNNNNFYTPVTLGVVLFFLPQHSMSNIIAKNTNLSMPEQSKNINLHTPSNNILKYSLIIVYIVYFLLFCFVLTPQSTFWQLFITLLLSIIELACISLITLNVLNEKSALELSLRAESKTSRPNPDKDFKVLIITLFIIWIVCYLGIGFVLENNHKYIFILPLIKLLITYVNYIYIRKSIFYSWFYNYFFY